MIPRVRLKYVQGLAAVHEDLRQPREVDLTTNGELLIVSSAASGRPLAKLPLAAIDRLEVKPVSGLITATNQMLSGLTGTEQVLVLQARAAPGVPATVAEQPIIFADPHDEDVSTRLPAVRNVLQPRTPDEMARLERGERRVMRYYAIGFIALVTLVLLVLIPLLLLVLAPRPRQASGQAPMAAAGYALPAMAALSVGARPAAALRSIGHPAGRRDA
jgi:hypothetical protein